MAGLLDWLNTPQGMGLLSAAAGGLAGARRGTPWNNVGRGAVSGLMGYSNAQDQIRQDEENAFAKQYKQMQMEQMQAALAKQKGEQAWRANLPGMMTPKISDQGAQLNAQTADFGSEGMQATVDAGQYAQPGAPLRVTPQVDQQALQAYMLQPDSPYADKIMENMLIPSTEKPQLVTVYDEQGKPMQKWLRPGESDGVAVGMGKPDAGSQSSVGQMIAEMNRLPPNDPMRRVYQQAINKATTHAPAAQINNFGEPKPYWNEKTQRYEFYQFDKAGNPRVSPLPEGATPVEQGKLPEGQAKQVVGVNNLQGAITEYVDQLKTWKKQDALNPNTRAAMGVKYNNMMLQAKEAYNLGVLNGPDFEILTSVVTDPRSFTGAITSNKALESQANELSRIMNGIKKQAATKPRPTAQGQQTPAAVPLDEYLKSLGF